MNINKKLHLFFCIISLLVIGIGIFAPNTDYTSVIAGVLVFCALIILDVYTPSIAGLSKDNSKIKTMRRLNHLSMLLVVLGFSLFNWASRLEFLSGVREKTDVIIAVAFIVLIGNAAPKLPFNRYIGLRLPWTIRDEMTWRIAHKILGYITFPIVIVLIAVSKFAYSTEAIKYCIITWVAIPGIYSAWYYYKKSKHCR